MPWLWLYIAGVLIFGALNIIFDGGDNIGEYMFIGFLFISLFAAIIGLGVGTSYSQKPEHYHFIDTTYNLVECGDNIFTLTKDASGNVIYKYVYDDGTGKKIAKNISATENIVFEYSNTAISTITISDAIYNSKVATAWFVDPTVRNIKIIIPKDSIINTLY